MLSLAILALAVMAFASNANASGKQPPTCSELATERTALLQQSRLATSQVESKNTELGETAEALKAATSTDRKQELSRRVEALRRELTVLLDREHESTDRLGELDADIAKRCKKGSGK